MTLNSKEKHDVCDIIKKRVFNMRIDFLQKESKFDAQHIKN